MAYLVSAMNRWKGRTDSETDYESFRWHQKVEQIDVFSAKPFSGKVGIVFIGFCSDEGIERNKGRCGAALAPDIIRTQLANLPCTMREEVKLYDAGDIECMDIPLEEGQSRLAEVVERALALNLFPIVLGGGHETAFGHYMGHRAHYIKEGKKPALSIVNFDAHLDMRPYEGGSTSGSMFRQIADICAKDGVSFSYMPIGLQLHSNTIRLFKTAKELGAECILAKDIKSTGLNDTLERMDAFLYDKEDVYLTVCTDVFSSAFAPGVSATQTLGLDPETALPLIKHILRVRRVRGFDICEVSPRFDHDNTTANLAAVIIFAVVNTMCECCGLVMR